MRFQVSIHTSVVTALVVSALAFTTHAQKSSSLLSQSAKVGIGVVGSRTAYLRPSDLPLKPPMMQRIYAPLVRGPWTDGQLVLNNNSPTTMFIMSTFYSDGDATDGMSLTLQPAEVRWIALSELSVPTDQDVKANDGLELKYVGQMMELGAQLALIGSRRAGSVDVPFSEAGDYKTSVQEAVWPSSKGSEAIIALGNASDTPVFVTVQTPSERTTEIEIGPHATRTLKRESAATYQQPRTADWVRLDVRGAVGSLRATGFVAEHGRVVSGIRFYDPGTARQANLFASNLHVADAWPSLALKNTSDINVTATPVILSFDSSQPPIDLKPVILVPHASVLVPLQALLDAVASRTDLAHVSIQVLSTGAPGALIGALSALSRDAAHMYDIPLRDSGSVGHATGSYPWRIDGDYNTVITITNVSNRPAIYHARINFDGGVYWFAPKEIAIGGTAIFDLRQLRDHAIPDMYGHALPMTSTGGQFRWSNVLSHAETQLTGRAEIVSTAVGQSSSYSCWVCCPDSAGYGYLSPDAFSVAVGGTGDTGVIEHWHDCYGNPAGEFGGYATSWSIGTPSVTSMWTVQTGVGRASGNNDGSSSVLGTWSSQGYNVDYDTSECIYFEPVLDAPGNVNVDCGDQRDSIKQEYVNYSVSLSPMCLDFTQSRHSSYFGFGEINTGDYSWALVRDPLIASSGYGLDQWRANYGSSRIINSSYRNPARNASVGGAAQSRHMYGDAADLRNQSGSVSEWNAMQTAASNAGADFIEPQNGPCGLACTHADWRNHGGGYR
jgi:hypothetical protein